MAENSSGKRMSISFTLPISCQICLGKVKQPIVCPNHHVFCSACIELWLQHNQQCPTCRVPITPENPCKQIIGGQNQENDSDFYMSNPALRRARFDILYQDSENEIKRLQQENETLKNSNCQLQEQLQEQIPTSPSSEAMPKAKTKTWRDQSHLSPRSSPSASKLKSKGRWVQDNSSPGPKRDRHCTHTCTSGQRDGGCCVESSHDDSSDNGEMLAALRSKLKQATSTYDKIKQDMDKLKEKNSNLSADNRALLMESGRLKQAAATRSPRKYEKYTSMAQQSKLNQFQREVAQLKSALERSDNYVEELETELQDYKSLFGLILRKRPCHTKTTIDKALTTSGNDSQGITTAESKSVLSFKRMGNNQGETSHSDEAGISSASSGWDFNQHNPLKVEDDDQFIFLGKPIQLLNGIGMEDSINDPSTYHDTSSNNGKFLEEVHPKLTLNKKASRVLVDPKQRASTVGNYCKRVKVQLDSDDGSDLDEPNPVLTNTPSTALGRLSLDSTQKPQRSSSSFEGLSASHDPEFKLSPSCHRQLDFGKDLLENANWQSTSSVETQGLMLEGNSVDVGPLDQNATFSDLNFTLTSEFSDCAQLMKEAEKRVKTKRLSSREGEARCTTQIQKSKDEVDRKSSEQRAVFQSLNPVKSDRENFKYFTPVTSSQDNGHNDQTTDRGDHCKSNSLQNKSSKYNVNFDSDNTQVTWSKNRLDLRHTERSASTEPQEPVVYMSSTTSLTSAGLVGTSRSANYTSYGSCKSTSPTEIPSYASLSYTNTKKPTVISQSSTAAASKVDSTRVNRFQPTIKPQLMKLRHDADAPECTNGRGTGSL